jgi:hypothetical protein
LPLCPHDSRFATHALLPPARTETAPRAPSPHDSNKIRKPLHQQHQRTDPHLIHTTPVRTGIAHAPTCSRTRFSRPSGRTSGSGVQRHGSPVVQRAFAEVWKHRIRLRSSLACITAGDRGAHAAGAVTGLQRPRSDKLKHPMTASSELGYRGRPIRTPARHTASKAPCEACDARSSAALDHPALTQKVSADHHQRAGVRPIWRHPANRIKANVISLPLVARVSDAGSCFGYPGTPYCQQGTGLGEAGPPKTHRAEVRSLTFAARILIFAIQSHRSDHVSGPRDHALCSSARSCG